MNLPDELLFFQREILAQLMPARRAAPLGSREQRAQLPVPPSPSLKFAHHSPLWGTSRAQASLRALGERGLSTGHTDSLI